MAAPSRTESLSQQYLRECFDYDPETGECVWIARPENHFHSKSTMKRFKTMHVGKSVGSKVKSGRCSGYIVVKLKGVSWYLHRLIYTWMTGEQPFNIDHINHNKEDNRWCNLREATVSENSANVPPSRSSTGYKGITFENGKYRASLTKDMKTIRLGWFDTAEEAAMAYDKAAKEHHGEFAYLNFGEDNELG